MKGIIRIVLVLTCTCILCAFFLSFIDRATKEKIEVNQKMRMQKAIVALAPDADEIKKVERGSEMVYELFDKPGNLVGYAFVAEGQGYAGKIKMVSVLSPDLRELGGVEIIESVETPGLGGKIQNDFFKNRFQGISVEPRIEYTKDDFVEENQVQAITGATISSKAVVNILNKKITLLKNKLR